jgi:hypothetical protein
LANSPKAAVLAAAVEAAQPVPVDRAAQVAPVVDVLQVLAVGAVPWE